MVVLAQPVDKYFNKLMQNKSRYVLQTVEKNTVQI